MKPDSYLLPCTNLNSKWTKGFSITGNPYLAEGRETVTKLTAISDDAEVCADLGKAGSGWNLGYQWRRI